MEIVLRAVEEADLPVLFEHQRDPDANRMAAFPARERDAFVAHWRGILADDGVIARTILADGQVVGDILSWEDDGRMLLGYWIGREHWGRGIATRALAAFVEEVATRPLYAKVAVHNAGSIRVLEKCGFLRGGEPERGDDGIVDLLYALERSGASHSAG
jgi:RimJ/RimL family protein N-acetyltransferase